MANLTDAFKLTKSFFSTFGKANTEASQKLFESIIKSGQNISITDIRADAITYCVSQASADAWVTANPTIGHKYDAELLTEVSGSNGQAWYIDDTGRVDGWISPVDVPNVTTKAPSYGFEPYLYQNDGVTRVMPADGAWLYDPYSGVIFFQEGFTPADMGYGIPRITCYNYIGAKGASGGGALTVLDEGVSLGSFTSMNFIGVDVLAEPGVPNTVNVFIPTPPFPSHFNTADGNTNATINALGTTARNVSSPTVEGTPFNLGAWVGGSSHPCVNVGNRTHTTTGGFRVNTDDGSCTLTCNVYDADGVSVLATHSINLTGNYGPTTVQNITMQLGSWATEIVGFSAILQECSVDLTTIIPNGGHCTVEIVMNDGTTDYTFIQEFFYDINDTVASFTGMMTCVEGATVNTRRISGVNYYTNGSQFNESIPDMDELNSDSYPTNQVAVTYPNMGLAQQNLTGADLTGWTNAHDNVNASHNNPTWAISINQVCFVGATASQAQISDWAPGAINTAVLTNNCVNTFTDNSTGVYEDFRLEARRLTSALVAWDNTQDITSYDGGNGLQVGCSRLGYPTLDYTAYNPVPASQFDYSGQAGDKYWYGHMEHSGVAHSNGMFELGDYNITEADLTNDDVIIEISLDGTDWYNCNEAYGGGPLSAGDGCRINAGTNNLTANNQIQFTLGAGGTTGAGTGTGWGVYIRITFTDTDTSNYIGELQVNDWV